jgi:hypothetical protein
MRSPRVNIAITFAHHVSHPIERVHDASATIMGPGVSKISQTLSILCDYDDALHSRCHFVPQNRRNITIIGAAAFFGDRRNWCTILRNPLSHQNEEVRMLGPVSLIILGQTLFNGDKAARG